MTGTHHIIFVAAFVTVIEGARDGGWSDWGRWSRCSATCGFSTQQRIRLCNDPPPSEGGLYCEGSPRERRPCDFVTECPVDGGWTSWSGWSECSKTCGRGVRRRQRTCTDPAPQGDGRDCDGALEQRETCTLRRNCPRDGQWSTWSTWSECSVTCGEGTRLRYRSCNRPPPSNGGRPCRGLPDEVDNCRAPVNCAIDGHWSGWSAWSPCLVTCGVAEIQRVRSCDDPPPLFGGEDCAGDSRETDVCDPGILCPVNGQWSEWSDYSPCLASNCHLRKYSAFRQRSCNNPTPAHGGRMCKGSFLRAGMCTKPINCPVNGGWSEWSEWKCSAEVAKKTRECDNPPPMNGGKPCSGDEMINIFREEDAGNFGRLCRKKLQNDDEDLQPEGSGSGQGPA